jgi:hypothetical protein
VVDRAQHLGIPERRNTLRDSAITRVEHHLHAAGNLTRPVHAEGGELLGGHTHLTGGYRDEATAHVRFITDMQQRSRGPNYGLEL